VWHFKNLLPCLIVYENIALAVDPVAASVLLASTSAFAVLAIVALWRR